MSSPELDALATGARHLLAGKYFQIAAFVMLLYDHALTFSDEVERVWKKKISYGTTLFLINRYASPLEFIVILDAFDDSRWTMFACKHFVIFEGAATVALVAICQLIMILRVYALWNRSTIVMTVLLTLWTAQIVISAVGLHTGFAVPLPAILTGCILTGSGSIFPSIWISALVTDTFIFIFTIGRTHQYIRDSGKAPTLHLFVRDGALYFFVIFMANLLNTLMFFLAPSDLKAIGASFSQLITSLMVSRLYLSLRSNRGEFSGLPYGEESINLEMNTISRIRPRRHDQSFLTQTVAGVEEDVQGTSSKAKAEYFSDDKPAIVPLSSMSLRRKLDYIPNNV
ncbi:hypothetical protein BJ912DRAFT_903432 [Pholiota molesta]|nr:hypothetical protein BJ912DRAFT_903432 [Pholiota molesta]